MCVYVYVCMRVCRFIQQKLVRIILILKPWHKIHRDKRHSQYWAWLETLANATSWARNITRVRWMYKMCLSLLLFLLALCRFFVSAKSRSVSMQSASCRFCYVPSILLRARLLLIWLTRFLMLFYFSLFFSENENDNEMNNFKRLHSSFRCIRSKSHHAK